jgi:hypothetical protein
MRDLRFYCMFFEGVCHVIGNVDPRGKLLLAVQEQFTRQRITYTRRHYEMTGVELIPTVFNFAMAVCPVISDPALVAHNLC